MLKSNFIDNKSLESINGKETLKMLNLKSACGRKLLRNFAALKSKDYKRCIEEYKNIQNLINILNENKSFYDELTNLLAHIEDLSYTFDCLKDNLTLDITQLFEIKEFIFFTRLIYKVILKHNLEKCFKIHLLDFIWDLLDVEKGDSPHFFISSLYNKKLQEYRLSLKSIQKEIEHEENFITEKIKKELNFLEAKETIIVSRMNKSLLNKLDKTNLYTKIKQSFANVTYEINKTSEILDLEYKKEHYINKIKEEECKVRIELSRKIENYSSFLIENTKIIANLDLMLAKAKYSLDLNCVIPEISKDKIFNIVNGRNIFLEKECKNKGLDYHPVNIKFDNNVILITGSNMGGKSVLLKTLGNIFFHLSFTIPIPAEHIKIPLIDFIYFSVDSNREEQTGLSCFGSELYELNKYASIEEKFGLYLIDELARGTNPYEGEAFCTSILRYLKNKNSLTVCVTHFSKPTQLNDIEHFQVIGLSQINKDELKKQLNKAKNLNDSLKLLNKNMNYNLVKVTNKSDIPHEALTIAELLGVDNNILNNVREILFD